MTLSCSFDLKHIGGRRTGGGCHDGPCHHHAQYEPTNDGLIQDSMEGETVQSARRGKK